MPRVILHKFDNNEGNSISMDGTYYEKSTDTRYPISALNMPFDPTLTTSVREQVLAQLVDAVNLALTPYNVTPPVIGSDIEILT